MGAGMALVGMGQEGELLLREQDRSGRKDT